MKKTLIVLMLLVCCIGCSYSGPYVTKIAAGPNNTLSVETAEVCQDWFFGLMWTVNRRTEQVALPRR
jgi:hypothetical protein